MEFGPSDAGRLMEAAVGRRAEDVTDGQAGGGVGCLSPPPPHRLPSSNLPPPLLPLFTSFMQSAHTRRACHNADTCFKREEEEVTLIYRVLICHFSEDKNEPLKAY